MDNLSDIKGIGPKRIEALNRLGIHTLADILYNAPRAYLDYQNARAIASLEHGMDTAVTVRIDDAPRLAFPRRGLSIVSARAQDETGALTLVWYNQPYRKNHISAGALVTACGRVDTSRGKKLINPTIFEKPPGILPVYSLSKGLNQRLLRESIRAALKCGPLQETLSEAFRLRHDLCELNFALENIHFPGDFDKLELARRRLAFEELLMYLLMVAKLRERRHGKGGIAFKIDSPENFAKTLPFTLTSAQTRAMDEIARDMRSTRQMNRMVQGDVGSGKTVVALFALQAAIENGYQGAFMAPTEILARQHYNTAKELLGCKSVLITGSMKKSERAAAEKLVESGEAKLIIGTHALITQGIKFNSLGLVVADEQHRFGVRERTALQSKGECAPDVLVMSATPIPRSLSLALYGDLDISVIDELPPGRKPILTKYVSAAKRDAMYAYILEQVKAGFQAYVVCPLVEPGEDSSDTCSCEEVFEELSSNQLKDARLRILHGRLATKQKQGAIDDFAAGEVDVLVATTVVEVGVDVPNATVMVIERADRFGLAQLHQLRGRVGRGGASSYCFVLSPSTSETTLARLRALITTQSGFEIAKKDLQLRGPGEFLGERQHGVGIGLAWRYGDMEFFEQVKACAQDIIKDRTQNEESKFLLEAADALYSQKLKSISLN